MSPDIWLRLTAGFSFSAGVAAIVLPRLGADLNSAASFLFLALTIAAFAVVGLYMATGLASVLTGGKYPLGGREWLLVSVQLILIAMGAALGQSGAISSIAVPVTIVGMVLVVTSVLRKGASRT